MLKEIEAGATLENCRALINQITVGLSAEKPFVDFLSGQRFCCILILPVLLSKSPRYTRQSRRSSSVKNSESLERAG
jgi:hypothetical protein